MWGIASLKSVICCRGKGIRSSIDLGWLTSLGPDEPSLNSFKPAKFVQILLVYLYKDKSMNGYYGANPGAPAFPSNFVEVDKSIG